MEQVSTPNECKRINVIRKGSKSDLYAPSEQSLFLIMQFAAAYHIERRLSLKSLSEMILN